MFNKDVLQQLNQLKQTIREAKDIVSGTVKGTSGRFGFVNCDDGRDVFLNPDEMQKVFPGDRVEVAITENDKGQLEGTLEKLLETTVKNFVGRYEVRGKGHFATVDLPFFNHWLFVPPKQRRQAQAGELIEAKVIRHPYHDGKCQAEVVRRLGTLSDPFIERTYALAKYTLPHEWLPAVAEQLQDFSPTLADAESRQDLTSIPFVTIDSQSTKDMDDALFARKTDSGYSLHVAIADPSALVAPDSAVGKTSAQRLQTLYFPGNPVTMLPEALAHHHVSLCEGEERPALVCNLTLNEQAVVEQAEFVVARIRSRQKLSYQGVTELLDAGTSATITESTIVDSLKVLDELAKKRFAYREQHALTMEDKADYALILNDKGKIDRIEKHDKTRAHKLVEEAMLTTNIAAGDFFAQHNIPALFSTHGGFREDRLEHITQLLNKTQPDLAVGDLTTLDGYVTLIKNLQQLAAQSEDTALLLAQLKRQLKPGELSTEPKPHLGLGLKHYATITSPIRRYNDFHNHLLIKQHLQQSNTAIELPATTEAMQEQLSNGRKAVRQTEQWLICQYMADKIGTTYDVTVVMVNSQGVGVRIEELGIEGFVLLRTRELNRKDVVFDADRITLQVLDKTYRHGDRLNVVLSKVDDQQRQINFTLAPAVQEETQASE